VRPHIISFLHSLGHSAAGGVTEVCVFQGGDIPTHVGYFKNIEAAAKAIEKNDGYGNIFVSLDPCKRDLLARGNNRLVEGSFKRKLKRTTNDEILRKSWFFLDIDPQRPRGISSTDEELNAAIEVGQDVRDWLLSIGVPTSAILTAKSGNGVYVLVRLPDYEITKELSATTATLTKHIASLFNTEQVKIDDSVHNAARLVCALGTMKVKGENIPERPHRRSSIGSIAGEKFDQEKMQQCAPFDLFALAARILPKEEPKVHANSYRGSASSPGAFDIRDYLHTLNNQKSTSRGFSYFDCPNCGGAQKLYVNESSGAYGCFHIGAGTCSIEGIRESLGRPKILPVDRSARPASPRPLANAPSPAGISATGIATAPQAEPQPEAIPKITPEVIPVSLFDGEVTLEMASSTRGKVILIARNCTKVLHRDELSLNKNSDRAKFVQELALPDDQQLTMHQALLTLADRLDQERAALAGELGELNERLPGGFTISQQLIQIAEEGAELFRDPGGECYASIAIANHRETYKLSSRDFNDWLSGYFFDATGCAASDDKVKEATRILRHKAKRAGVFDVHIRVAEHEGAIYLDMVNDTWQQVRISEDGWKVIESADSPVRFRRAGGMLALPTPTRDGSLKELRALLNLDDDNKDEWALILGWLVGTFKPCNLTRFAYPLLAVHGEQGSAKSTACRFFRRLIDPNKADLRSTPKSEEDLAIAADHGRILAFDNLTYFSDSMSNALCRIATGGGFATRELFTNEGEVIFDSQRPVIINGIAEVVSKSDLLDRSLLIYLPRIPPNKRKLDRKLDLEFAKAQPRVLGALLDAVSVGLGELRRGVELVEPPRLADFAEWVVACESGLGLEKGAFLSAYVRNQEKANGLAIEASPVAQAVTSMIEECKDWQGTPGGLLKILNGRIVASGENPKTKHGWPASAKGLSAKLHELAPNLRRCGIEIAFGERTKQGYILTLKFDPIAAAPKTSTPSTPSTPAMEIKGLGGELGGEHRGELVDSQAGLKFTEDATSVSSGLGEMASNKQVYPQVHPVSRSEQRAGVLGVLSEHHFATPEIANNTFEGREVLSI